MFLSEINYLGKLEVEVHFAEGDTVARAEGLQGVRREALGVDGGAVHRAQVFDVKLVAGAGQAEVAARHPQVEAAIWPQVNVRVPVALRVAPAHDDLCAVREWDRGGGRGRRHHQLSQHRARRC